MPTIYTIGFAGKTRDPFIEILNAAKVRVLVDIRLWRTARFVPWASGTNLASTLGDRYRVISELAPTRELLTAYRDGTIGWPGYETIFNNILRDRKIEKLFTMDDLDDTCFLCTEKSPDRCHRRLVAEYFATHLPDIKIVHL
jgi:uncharacterized protein (DUF488 family)